MNKKVIGIVDRTGLCLDTDDELIHKALMRKTYQLERKLQRGNLTTNERSMVQDEYERTFALTEKYRWK